jgi:Dienelactone hydrolase family
VTASTLKFPSRPLALTAAGIDHDIKVYPNAGHGFLNDHDPDNLSRLDTVIAKLAAAGYHEPSARDARTRIIAFFRTHLVDAPATAWAATLGMFLGQCLPRPLEVRRPIHHGP